ncbi:sodium:alanine symporter family protein [uncultured Cetobacterium sp.]|uniref:alanine/glycine:cation symporter family protein n=1 Tax=uncultured Cetobacterium sp. TaxID=527638 RepID=UPI002633345B|nr:alanine/glycine:cation symporter family protein [uncultured Cetobacterium sp.]
MGFFNGILNILKTIVSSLNSFLWGDVINLNFGEMKIGLSILVLMLIPTGVYYSVKTRMLSFRLFPQMIKIILKNKVSEDKEAISGLQALFIATASRVGMGNLAGVVAAVSFGGPGAIFWMWIAAIIGSNTAFIESTLAQIYKEKDPLYGGWRGGPAYFMDRMRIVVKINENDVFSDEFNETKDLIGEKKKVYKRTSTFKICGLLFAISGLITWVGITQIVSNSVSESFKNAFGLNPLYTSIGMTVLGTIVLFGRGNKDKIVDVLNRIVPIMAILYFTLTLFILIKNIGVVPEMFREIFEQAFGTKQMAAGGFGAVLMQGVKRGLFSNEAGSGSAPCAAAAADVNHPAEQGLIQALGVFIDTLVVCSCTAFVMLLAPSGVREGKVGMDLLQSCMDYHIGSFGTPLVAIILFLGILFYARSNVAYIFGDKIVAQNAYKIFALMMLFVGGMAQYLFVWELGDLGVALMTVFNLTAILPMSTIALTSLKDYETKIK